MKKIAIVVAIMAAVMGTVQADENSFYQNPPAGMIRGVINVCTSPLEVFRGPIYWGQAAFNDHPIVLGIDGVTVGLVSGTALTAARMTVGVLDFFFFGLPGNYIHGDVFPEFSWDAPWCPEVW